VFEHTLTSTEHFLLIEDFRLSLQKAPFRIDRLEETDEVLSIAQDMHAHLDRCTRKLELIQVSDIWSSLREFIDPQSDYVVSLDGDFLIRDPDAMIEITRAARSIEEAENAMFVRIPRSIGTGVLGQVKYIEHQFHLSEKERVVLFDDGLGTGKSMKRIIELLNEVHILPDRVVVLANPHCHSQIDGIPVKSVFSVPPSSAWLNERDLYWGLPRSGVSLIPRGKSVGLGGVPYTSSKILIQNRIGLHENYADQFYVAALQTNARLWSTIDHAHARKYPFRDCPRLAVYAEARGIDPDRSISNYIEQTQRIFEEKMK